MADLEIREQIHRYLNGEIDAPALEDWLENTSWDAVDAAGSLGENVLRLLAEHANGDWTDGELREQLGSMSRTYWFGRAPKHTYVGSAAQVIRQDQSSAVTGTRLVVASV